MGNWNFTVRGVGSHHNKGTKLYDAELNDADRIVARCVEELKKAGHTVVAASFTHGGESDVSQPVAYLASCRAGDEK